MADDPAVAEVGEVGVARRRARRGRDVCEHGQSGTFGLMSARRVWGAGYDVGRVNDHIVGRERDPPSHRT